MPIRFFVQLWSLQFSRWWRTSATRLEGPRRPGDRRAGPRLGTRRSCCSWRRQHGIKYKNVSYVPGSQVRALALIKGNIRASILDATNKNFLMRGRRQVHHPAAR